MCVIEDGGNGAGGVGFWGLEVVFQALLVVFKNPRLRDLRKSG